MQDILEIQDRLQRVRGEIERLRGQLNVLEDRVALATVRVQLHPPPDLSLELVPQGVPCRLRRERVPADLPQRWQRAGERTWR